VAEPARVRAFFSGALPHRHSRQQRHRDDAEAVRRAGDKADFDETYRSSVGGVRIGARSAPCASQGRGAAGDASVVNIASMYGVVSPDRRIYAKPEQASPFHYGPAKAALLQLTRHLAAELGPERYSRECADAGSVSPRAGGGDDPAFAERLASRTMLGRTGRADEIAGPLLFLASKASTFVTGSTARNRWRLDGLVSYKAAGNR
jgi:NAD(P)-dependent dehydrogenase (short-subunit alcohol dehydrogenase family)